MKIEEAIVDDVAWAKAWMDTPLGCAVKSRKRGADRLPEHYGILVSYDEAHDRVVVRGHNTPVSPRFVWFGTVRQYLSLWECD